MRIAVIGQGFVGLSVAISAAEAGHIVTGLDNDPELVSNLLQGLNHVPGIQASTITRLIGSKNYIPTSKLEQLNGSEAVIIAVPTPLTDKFEPDLYFLETAVKSIAQFVLNDALIINESTSYPGTLRNFVRPIIEKISNFDFLYASAPERIDPGNIEWTISNTPRVIAGLTSEATEMTIKLYKSFCSSLYQASSPEVAEAAKLFENTFRMVNIALVNEFASIADKLDFSTFEAITAANTKPFGFMPFYPSIGVGGHCIPVDPQYLTFVAKLAGADSKLIDLAQQINLSMPSYSIQKIKSALKHNLMNKKIQIAGIAYKPETPDLRESPALELIIKLRETGAFVSWHDPIVKNFNGEFSSSLDENIDLGLIITPHSQIDFSIWKKANVKVLDLSANSSNYGWPKFL